MLVKQKIFTDIHMKIPEEILNVAFLSTLKTFTTIPTTVDDQIDNLVIKPKVLLDTNLVSGMQYTIPLEECEVDLVEYNPSSNYMVITVPMELTNNKLIITPLSLTFFPYVNNNGSSMYSFQFGNVNPGLALTERAMDAVDPTVGGVTTSNLELIGPNVILVHENIIGAAGGWLRVTIENDENFNNIKPAAAMILSDLVLEAVKGYIYNKLVIQVDKGYVYGGHEINKFADILETYSDAWERYDEIFREKWMKVAFANDDEAMSRFIRNMIFPNI